MENNFFLGKAFKALIFAAGTLVVSFLVFALILKIHDVFQAFSNPAYPNKTIGAAGQSKIMLTPDVAYLSFSYQNSGADEKTLATDSKKITADFKQFLVKKGVDEKSITTTQYYSGKQSYSSPEQQYTYNESFNAELQGKNMQEPLRDIATEALAKNLLSSGSNNNIGCATYENLEDSIKPALKEALEKARTSARNLAEMSGLKIGGLVSISDSTSYPFPQPYNTTASQSYYTGSCNGLPITPNIVIAPQEVFGSVTANFELQ